MNIINLRNPFPSEGDIQSYEKDFAHFLTEFENVRTDLHVAVPEAWVEFYGDDTGSIAVMDYESCPSGVSDFTAENLEDRSNERSEGEFIFSQ